MKKSVIVTKKIDQLIPDDINANKGTKEGQALIEKSLRDLGAGRSILLDKNDRIIAGNKTILNAAKVGLNNVIIVETTGDQIVAVKRKDIDLDSKKGRELALSDNATAKTNIEWDEVNISMLKEAWDLTPEEWKITDFSERFGPEQAEKEWKGMPEYESEDLESVKRLIVHFKSLENYLKFAKLVGQHLSEKTKYIWYPKEAEVSQKSHEYDA